MLHFGCTDTVGTLLKCPDHQGVLSSGGKGGGLNSKVVWDLEIVSCISRCPYFKGSPHLVGVPLQ